VGSTDDVARGFESADLDVWANDDDVDVGSGRFNPAAMRAVVRALMDGVSGLSQS